MRVKARAFSLAFRIQLKILLEPNKHYPFGDNSRWSNLTCSIMTFWSTEISCQENIFKNLYFALQCKFHRQNGRDTTAQKARFHSKHFDYKQPASTDFPNDTVESERSQHTPCVSECDTTWVIYCQANSIIMYCNTECLSLYKICMVAPDSRQYTDQKMLVWNIIYLHYSRLPSPRLNLKWFKKGTSVRLNCQLMSCIVGNVHQC